MVSTKYCVFVCVNLVSWKNKKPNAVARYSAKAKYRTMTTAMYKLEC